MSARCASRRAGASPGFRSSYAARSLHLQPAAPRELPCTRCRRRSTDGSRSWQEVTAVTPSKFGFAVAAHPQDADTAWFVPAVKDECRVPVDGKLVVARTRDAGKSFQALGKGLPQQHAYDLVYRHGLAVDASGKHLALGSTTGGLWISENQGDSWECISTQLPPIYCVRFAD